jgi:DHA1 family bicyclomycin/chloramphenicol resistance-like MFS transporter
MGLVPVLAPSAGAYLVGHFGWQMIFWCLALFGTLCLAAVIFGLKETSRIDKEASLHPVTVLRSYASLFTDRRFLGYSLSGAIGNGAFFVYLTGSPFVLMEIFGVSPRTYSWLFALNSIGLVLGSQLNHRLLARHPLEKPLTLANLGAVILSAILLLLSVTEVGGVTAFAAVLFGFVASRAFIRSNATAAALEFQANRAGTAAAMIGSLQFALGTAGGALLGVLHDGTARPFALTLAIFALLGLMAQWMLARERPLAAG